MRHPTELRALLRLGLPSAITQLGTMMLGVVDTMMVGRLGTVALDAAALGTLWIYGTTVFAIGLIWGMDPLISQAHGASDGPKIALTTQRGLVLAALVTPILMVTWWLTEPALLLFGQSPQLCSAAAEYVWIQAFSLWPFLAYFVLRQYLQGRTIVMPALVVMLVANGFNVVANWALIFGNLGLPELGLNGAGLATGLTRCFTFFALVAWIVIGKLHRGAWQPFSRASLQPRGIWEIAALGIPVGIHYALEGWAFQFASLMAGLLGEAELAAHIITLNLASLTFMIPLGLSQGTATRIGNLVGAGQSQLARTSSNLALWLGGGVMAMSALLFVGLRDVLPLLYTHDPTVVALAATTLPIAGAFQIFDGVQVVGGGILRGVGATRPAAVFNLVGYYVLSLPLAAMLVLVFDLGLSGLWWGLAFGLALVASALVLWIRRRVDFEPLT